MKPRKAVIPAAGLGTRFLPATKIIPKELLPIVDRPALEYIVEELIESGIEEIILVIHPEKEAIMQHFSQGGTTEAFLKKRNKLELLGKHRNLLSKCSFTKVYQREPLGLGHAVLCAKEYVGNEPFAVALPDDLIKSKTPCLKQLIALSEKEGISSVAVEEVKPENVKHYGIVAGKEMNGRNPFRIEKIVEKPSLEKAPSRFAIVGRYLFDAAIFKHLEQLKPGAIGEIQLTDGMELLAKERGLMALPFEGMRLDAGQPGGFIEANIIYGLDQPEIAKKIKNAVGRES